MSFQYLLLEVADKVATVTLHRPDKGNALAPYVLEEVITMFTALSARQDVNVVVLTGGERYFSAGFDLNEIRKLEKLHNEAYTALFHRAYRAIMFCEQPVICAIGGAAIAGGFDLTMMCDNPLRFDTRQVRSARSPARHDTHHGPLVADHWFGARQGSGTERPHLWR